MDEYYNHQLLNKIIGSFERKIQVHPVPISNFEIVDQNNVACNPKDTKKQLNRYNQTRPSTLVAVVHQHTYPAPLSFSTHFSPSNLTVYSHDNHTLIGYPYTENLPLLDHQFWASSQPNIPPPMCFMSINSGLNTMGYKSFCGNEGNIYASPKDFSPGLLQRSMSSYSLQNGTKISSNGWFKRLGLVSGLENYSVRKVFSTGDLQMIKEAQHSSRAEGSLPSESSSIIESMNKACPYSPEEKKERIERYRSKRIHRNFTKKIKYECRKILAENRPRVKGRFARNDEIVKKSQSRQSRHECAVEDYEDDNNWLNLLDSFSANMIP